MSDYRSDSTVVTIIKQLSERISRVERRGLSAPTYTTATRPPASSVSAGAIIFVSDAGAGSQFQGSDGTTWRTLG